MLNQNNTLTEEEQWELEDYYYDLEKQWKATLPVWTEWQWAAFFGDNPTVIRAGMKYRIARANEALDQLVIKERSANQTILDYNERPVLEYILEEIKKEKEKHRVAIRMAKGILNRYCKPKKKPPAPLPTDNPQQGITVTAPKPVERKITELDRDNAKMIPIEQIYGGPWKHTGGTLTTRCPFHTEKTPSFTVYRKNNTFYCFGCQKGGDVIRFVMEQQNVDFKEAIKILLGL